MAKECVAIDISDRPELFGIIEQVRATGEPCVLTRGGEELAILAPVNAAKRTRRPRRKTGTITADDPLWDIVGIGRSEGPGDISENKHRYLAEAYADLHE
jgi:antitoxin (DNA-binding transcriptional repressor) of toxin-antitoxin stability system